MFQSSFQLLSSSVSLSTSFTSEPGFLHAFSTDPDTASVLGPLSPRGDELGMEDARLSVRTPVPHLAGDMTPLCPSEPPGIMLLFPSHWVRITLSRQTLPHGPWGTLGFVTYELPGDKGIALPFSNILNYLEEICLPLHQAFGHNARV